MPAAPWSLRFSDGSGNTTTFAQLTEDAPVTYQYSPVTPERSSSGVYSGGEPAQGTMTDVQTNELWTHVDALSAASDEHVEQRMMGTGQFEISQGDTTDRFIYPNGEELREFVEFLEGIRAKN